MRSVHGVTPLLPVQLWPHPQALSGTPAIRTSSGSKLRGRLPLPLERVSEWSMLFVLLVEPNASSIRPACHVCYQATDKPMKVLGPFSFGARNWETPWERMAGNSDGVTARRPTAKMRRPAISEVRAHASKLSRRSAVTPTACHVVEPAALVAPPCPRC